MKINTATTVRMADGLRRILRQIAWDRVESAAAVTLTLREGASKKSDRYTYRATQTFGPFSCPTLLEIALN